MKFTAESLPSLKPLRVSGWFKIIMPGGAIYGMEKCLKINQEDWDNRLVQSLLHQGCEFVPVNLLTDEELEELRGAKDVVD